MSNNDKLMAIYSRKSKYTGKGESIENQIEMCKGFIINKYGPEAIHNIVVFEDEGFTGANTNRPQFQQMLTEFKKGNFKILVVYRLDRVSRNVLDFCSLKDLLTNLKIDFISITENFDTSTPMGTAMLMITSVFAQLERDTIAERIRDNMHELAKTGRWLGGNTPLGFISSKKEFISLNNRKKNLYQLDFNNDEIVKVKLIFIKYKELNSLSKLESYLLNNHIKTRKNIAFSRISLVNILKNIVYCKADNNIKSFLDEKGIEIYTNNMKFDGQHGLIAYNKRIEQKSLKGKKRKDEVKSINDWIIAVGKHQGIVDGKDWIEVWQSLEKRHYNKRIKKVNGKIEALLSGILKCQHCGSYMRPKILKSFDCSGNRNFMYICELKSKSRKQLCHTENIKGNDLDKDLTNYLKKTIVEPQQIIKQLKQVRWFKEKNFEDIEKQNLENCLTNNNKKINGLIENLALADKDIIKIIISEIKTLKNKNKELKKKLIKLNNNQSSLSEKEIDKLSSNIINNYNDVFDKLSLELKRELIKLAISSIIYDGKNIYINLMTTTKTGSRSNS